MTVPRSLERPTRGRIVFDGEIWADTERGMTLPPQKRSVGYLSLDYALFPHLTGKISEITAYGPMKKVVVDVGFPIVALVTRQAAEDLDLGAGEEVAAVFKASAAHLIPRSHGSADQAHRIRQQRR